MLPDSQIGRPRLSVAGFGREGYVRGRAESGCSFFERFRMLSSPAFAGGVGVVRLQTAPTVC